MEFIMKNFTKKLTLLAVALVATSSVFSSNKIAFTAQRFLNALTVSSACDKAIAFRIANLAAQAAQPVASNALVPVVVMASKTVAPVILTVAREIVTPLVLTGGSSTKFDLVPVKTAYSAISEVLTRYTPNATGRNFAVAGAALAAVAGASYFAYYVWTKPAALVTAVETPVIEAVAPEVATSVVEAAAKPSTYSYVSSLIGTAWANAKSVVVPAMQKTLTKANEKKENVAVAGAIGMAICELQIKDAALKAQEAEEASK